MHVLYVDESGNPDPEPGSDHFVVAGLSIPLRKWKALDAELSKLYASHRLSGVELHTAWMARRYPEQERIADFSAMSDVARRAHVTIERKKDLAKASLRGDKAVKRLRTNYRNTASYIHLSHDERIGALRAAADTISSWTDARLFGEAHLKTALTPDIMARSREIALEQITTRFDRYLGNVHGGDALSLMVHDQHQAESTKLTELFRQWHEKGTQYAAIPHISETPLFVDSSLTAMVQMADLAAYATRRFFDKGETDLFDRIYGRYDRVPDGTLVGLRHYTAKKPCGCKVCKDHRR